MAGVWLVYVSIILDARWHSNLVVRELECKMPYNGLFEKLYILQTTPATYIDKIKTKKKLKLFLSLSMIPSLEGLQWLRSPSSLMLPANNKYINE